MVDMNTPKYRVVKHRYGSQRMDFDWRVYCGEKCLRVFWLKKDAIAWILKQEKI